MSSSSSSSSWSFYSFSPGLTHVLTAGAASQRVDVYHDNGTDLVSLSGGPQRSICKTTDRNRPDYSGFTEPTQDRRAGRLFFSFIASSFSFSSSSSSLVFLSSSSFFLSSLIRFFLLSFSLRLSLLTDLYRRYKKTETEKDVVFSPPPPPHPPLFFFFFSGVSEVKFPLLFVLSSPRLP